jgi:hypothetical protein
MKLNLTHIGWISIVCAILKGMGYLPWPWWVILLPWEISFGALILYWLISLIQYLTETEKERNARRLCEKLGAYRRAISRK